MSLRVDDAETDTVTAAQTSTAGTSADLTIAAGALDSHLDELAVWDSVLTDEQVDALVAARDSWRAFGGVIYGRQYAPTARPWGRLTSRPTTGRSRVSTAHCAST